MTITPKLSALRPKARIADFQIDASGAARALLASDWPASFATNRCPQCDYQGSTVSDSRPTTAHGPEMMRRRRTCQRCGFRITTIEVSMLAFDLLLKSLSASNALSGALRDLADQIDAHKDDDHA